MLNLRHMPLGTFDWYIFVNLLSRCITPRFLLPHTRLLAAFFLLALANQEVTRAVLTREKKR